MHGRAFRLAAPSAMLPEILLGILSHPLLEKLTVPPDHCVDVPLPFDCTLYLDRLEYSLEFTARLPEHVHEENLDVESQGEYRKSAGSLCRPPEKRDE